MRYAQFTEAVRVGQIGHGIHLIRRGITRGHSGFLERQRDHRVAGDLVREYVALDPVRKGAVVGKRGAEARVLAIEALIGRRIEE